MLERPQYQIIRLSFATVDVPICTRVTFAFTNLCQEGASAFGQGLKATFLYKHQRVSQSAQTRNTQLRLCFLCHCQRVSQYRGTLSLIPCQYPLQTTIESGHNIPQANSRENTTHPQPKAHSFTNLLATIRGLGRPQTIGHTSWSGEDLILGDFIIYVAPSPHYKVVPPKIKSTWRILELFFFFF